MELGLRKAAREQARRERQGKIEELRAKGIVVQTNEERERDQQEVEDLVEKARLEAAAIQRREKELAKKDGTFVKDGFDEEDSDDNEDDADFEEDQENDSADISDTEGGDEDAEEEDNDERETSHDDKSVVSEAEQESVEEQHSDTADDVIGVAESHEKGGYPVRGRRRNVRVLSDDDEDDSVHHPSPIMPAPAKTPQSLTRSARKLIPGLPVSDDLPIGLTQAFAATMANVEAQGDEVATQEEQSLYRTRDLPSPNMPLVPRLDRLESLDLISDSQPVSQVQPVDLNLSYSQSQLMSQTPTTGRDISVVESTPSQLLFEPTQDAGYMLSPFRGSRFGLNTPSQRAPQSTIETIILQNQGDESPLMQRKRKLQRRRINTIEDHEQVDSTATISAFDVLKKAPKSHTVEGFDKSKSLAKRIIDEAAEESEDEYAGLGGASDDEACEEDEEDRNMIDENTQIGKGDEAQFAGILADRERKQDEITARRREAKRREFAKMRRELLKDEAVGKIAEDRKKEAFLQSIEDREAEDDGEDDFDQHETQLEECQSQSQPNEENTARNGNDTRNTTSENVRIPLSKVAASTLNRAPASLRRPVDNSSKRPTTLAEIRETVSFLIDEPDSQVATIDLGPSDSEDDAEAYVDLDRHLNAAEADINPENDDEAQGLGDFIVDDDGQASQPQNDTAVFKKPSLPRAPYYERRTQARANVVDRLQLRRQASSSSSSTASTATNKLAFYTKSSGAESTISSLVKTHSLLRRATTSSSFGSMAGVEVSATGVTTTNIAVKRTERVAVEEEKEFIRKAAGGRRNAVNYRSHVKPVEEKMSKRAGVRKKVTAASKSGAGFLGGLFRGDSWG